MDILNTGCCGNTAPHCRANEPRKMTFASITPVPGGSHRRSFDSRSAGSSDGEEPAPQQQRTSWFRNGGVATLVLSILAPGGSAPAYAASAPAAPAGGYFSIAGFSHPPRKVRREVANAIPYGVINLSLEERRMVYGDLEQLNQTERVHV